MSPSFANVPGGMYLHVTNVPYFANIPANNTMNAAFNRKYFPGMRKKPGLQRGALPRGGTSESARFAGAAKAGGLGANGSTPTSAQLIKGLESLHGDTLGGMAPPLTFPAGQPHPIDCWFEAQMGNGKRRSSDRHPDTV